MARRTRTKLGTWRRIASGAWGPPTDPQIYGSLDVDATRMLEWIAAERERTGVRLTPTHIVGRALALGLAAAPELNVLISRGKAIHRETIDVFFIASVKGDDELSGVKVERVDERSAVDLARELGERAAKVRRGEDDVMDRSKKLVNSAPMPLLRKVIRLGGWLTSDAGLDAPGMGLPRYPFGSAMVTSVGMFGLTHGYAPLAAYYKVPLLIMVGALHEAPVAVDGQVEARQVLPITATIDHRYIDGSALARFAAAGKAYLADPGAFEPSE